MDFNTAFERLIGHEGGYIDHFRDPGGATKYGISQRSYPKEDIPNMTLERAKDIYRRDFWFAARCDDMPPEVCFDIFDMAVNSGVGTAVRMVQKVVGTTPDGVIGPRTLDAINRMPLPTFQARFNGARLAFMADLATWPSFGRGWARRIAANLMAIQP